MTMSSNIRHLDGSGTATLLTLPLSDFSKSSNINAADDEEDNDDLVLVSLSSSETDGGLTMNDILNSQNSVYILGDTSESDIAHSANAPSNHNNNQQSQEEEGANQYSSSFEPVAARLIVEPRSRTGSDSKKQAKTLDLVRVETSNTYIVTPPLAINNDGSGEQQGDSKRQKLTSSGKGSTITTATKQLVTMPARSIGVVPGENSPSCFFLDPMVLPQGHFANKLRTALGRWVYNPLEPPSAAALFGYTTRELAHICRSSLSEMEYALSNRVYGAEDALVIPDDVTRYGMLSEEGRQTVSMAIVSTLLESDLDLEWTSQDDREKAMDLLPLVQEVRSNWQREEGADNELADEVIWHGLRPIVSYMSAGSKDEMPKQVQLIVEEVAKLAAHHVFLRGTPRSAAYWEDDEFMEAWSIRLPTMTDNYQPSLELLGGIAISEMVEDKRQWRYFPASSLPLNPSLRIKSMLAMRNAWAVAEAKPYFEKLTMNESEIADLLKTHKK
eukprot:scaffold1088_cov120-Skeletonema_dohrnii-CCMP3373.AAC.4